jgi:hypothetical protein
MSAYISVIPLVGPLRRGQIDYRARTGATPNGNQVKAHAATKKRTSYFAIDEPSVQAEPVAGLGAPGNGRGDRG